MEFKNFENKLIIEKITNYCIENNINAQEINSLTAKIKFGKLNENAFTDWAGERIGTSGGNYRTSIKVVQKNLQQAINYLNLVNADLNPVSGDNIFQKNKVTLDPAKQAELQNVVSKLKDAIDQYSPAVADSLKQIGGQISGASNYGDEQSFDFDEMFPELKTGGTLAQAFTTAYTTAGKPFDKQADLNRILLNSRKNILKTFKVLDVSKHGEFIQKIKDNVAKVITNFNDPNKVADGYALLNTIVGGTNNPTPTSTPKPANPGSNPNTVAGLISNNDVNDKVAKVILSGTNLATITKIIQDAYDRGQSTRDIGKLITKASKQSATMKSVPSTITSNTTAATLLIKNIGYYLENPTAR